MIYKVLNNSLSIKYIFPSTSSIFLQNNLISSWEIWNSGSEGKDIIFQIINETYFSTNSTVEVKVNAFTKNAQSYAKMAILPPDNFVTVWQSWGQDGSDYGIYAQIFSNNGTKIGSEFQVNNYTKYNQDSPEVASFENGDFIVAWQSWKQDGSKYGIYAQKFSNNGTKTGSEFQVNNYTNYNQNYPTVASFKNGEFVVSWQSWGQDGSDYGIYAQRFLNNGTKIGAEFQVNNYTRYNQNFPTIASFESGDFIVAWQSWKQDGNKYGIYAQRFLSNGSRIGDEFQVNNYTKYNQNAPTVETIKNSGFVLSWQSWEQNYNGNSIHIQEYDSSGLVINNVTKVESNLNKNQVLPSSNKDIEGNAMITWNIESQDNLVNYYELSFVTFATPTIDLTEPIRTYKDVDLATLNTNQGIAIYGARSYYQTGISVSSAGDINGDGYDDVIIGAHQASDNYIGLSGTSYVIFGSAGGLLNLDLLNLSSADGFKIIGVAVNDRSGISVSSAGDINGDGYSDIIIGSYLADPNGRADAGTSYVIYGKNASFSDIDLDSLSLTQGFKIIGAAANDRSGISVSLAGDINGDGYTDIIIGANGADPNGRADPGTSYVIYGKNTSFSDIDLASLSLAQGFKILGAAVVDYSGFSVSSAGDINGDGYTDIIIGAPQADPNGRSNAGTSYVIYGKNTSFSDIDLASLSLAQGFKIMGAAVNDYSGVSVSSAGDVNNDGYSDIIIGAYLADPNGRTNAGTSYVIYGKNTSFSDIDLASLSLVQGFKIMGVAYDQSGYSVSSAGDVNGDGYSDIIIGAVTADPSGRLNAGTSYVIYGKNASFSDIDLASLSLAQGFKIIGVAANDQSGRSVSSAGDVNGDGYSDIIVGAYLADSNGRTDNGAAYIIYDSGAISSPSFVPTQSPTEPTVEPSVAPSSPTFQPTSKPSVPSSAPTAKVVPVIYSEDIDLANLNPNQGIAIYGARPEYRTGISASSAGDFNGDGYDDVIIGAHQASDNYIGLSGISYVIFGSAGGLLNLDLLNLSSADGFSITGAAVNDYSGYSVSSAGDVNGDGYSDIIIGAYGARSFTGVSYVIYGKNANFSDIDLASLSLAQGFKIMGAAVWDQSGISVSSAGDINGDGYSDIIIGSYLASPNGRGYAGTSYVIYGKNTSFSDIDLASLSLAQGFKIMGAVAYDYSGYSVSSAGDVNGDGLDDIIIGAFLADPNGRSSAGTSYVIYGKNTSFSDIDLASLSLAQGFKIMGAAVNDYSGYSVSSAGDVNGDGYSDIIIGAHGADPNGRSSAGTSYVIYGNNTSFSDIDLASLSLAQGFKIMGAAVNDYSGWSASSAGDINGDGYSDIIMGAPLADPNGRGGAGTSYVIYGRNNEFADIDLASLSLAQGLKIMGAAVWDQSGRSVSSAGDVNGDGYSDIIIGAFTADPNGRVDAGASYVIYGSLSAPTSQPTSAPSGLPSGQPTSAPSTQPSSQPSSEPTSAPSAQPSSYPTSPTSMPSEFIASPYLDLAVLKDYQGSLIKGSYGEDQSGSSVSSAGDFNGDGYDDMIVGAPLASPFLREKAGTSYIIFGKENGFGDIDFKNLGNQGFKIFGENPGDYSGCSVSSAGDFNGDGYSDIIIGARYADPNGIGNAGTSYVIYGKNTSFSDIDLAFLNSNQGFKILGAGNSDNSGYSVSSAGDFNGDGFSDIIIGAYAADPNGRSNAGTSYVIYGQNISFSDIDLASLSITQGVKIFGAAAIDYSGWSVSLAGDFNRDGFSDIIIGATHADPNGRASAGTSYLIFGNNAISSNLDLAYLSLVEGFKIWGAVTNHRSGNSVSSAGDINGDGYDDVIIGAKDANPPGRSAAGITYVIFGKNNVSDNVDLATLNYTQGIVINGNSGLSLGGSVSSARDINKDGYDDIIIGATNADTPQTNSGRIYIIYGNRTLNNMDIANFVSTQGFYINGAAANDQSGISVASAGDINGDGYSDIIIGAPYADPLYRLNAGKSYVIFGNSSLNNINSVSLTLPYGFSIYGESGFGNAGSSVSSAGDFNGDGYDDIIIGAPLENSSAGISYILFGSSKGILSSNLGSVNITKGFRIYGANMNEKSGSSVAPVGDINGDGYDDIIIGAPSYLSNTGRAYLVYGKNTSSDIYLNDLNSAGIIITGPSTGYYTGHSVAQAGDINGDGYNDILIGAYGYAGKVYVIYGSNSLGNINLGNLGTSGITINGEGNAYWQTGWSVASAGDVNGDGYGDILIGSPGTPPSNTGGTTLIFGNSSLSNINIASMGTSGINIIGAGTGFYTGFSVSSAGDINKDGYDDVIIGANLASALGREGGVSYLIYGKPGNFSDINLLNLNYPDGFIIYGSNTNGQNGYSVTSLGDINADGYPDIAIGALFGERIAYSGTVYVIYGKLEKYYDIELAVLNVNQGYKIYAAKQGDNLGNCVASAGDVNGDGYDDLIIGAPPAEGMSYIIYGSASGITSLSPTSVPTSIPSGQPTGDPSAQPSLQPAGEPTSQPSAVPSPQPTGDPSAQPTVYPTSQPSSEPTSTPTVQPSSTPSLQPISEPTGQPSVIPSAQPSVQPSVSPTSQPSAVPSPQPTGNPTVQPTSTPTMQPTVHPTGQPSAGPSTQPTSIPSAQPSLQPAGEPTSQPSTGPSAQPTGNPTAQPTSTPTMQPSVHPTVQPSAGPSTQPTGEPSAQPSLQPAGEPTSQPSAIPSSQPTSVPISQPSINPTAQPTSTPTVQPSSSPSLQPISEPTGQPSTIPSAQPSSIPSAQPSLQPTVEPTSQPSSQPSLQPISDPTGQPTSMPTMQPTVHPTGQPSAGPSTQPTSIPSAQPSSQPTGRPTAQPAPAPSSQPTSEPTSKPSDTPTLAPSILPKELFSTIDLLKLSNYQGIPINGKVSFDFSGFSVSDAGYTNADGYGDVVIGAPNSSPLQRLKAGSAFIVRGSRSPDSTDINDNLDKLIQIYGANAGDQCGILVNQAGDFNKDGLDDVIISCYYASVNSQTNSGAVYVIYGSNNGQTIDLSDIDSSQGFYIYGANAYDNLGFAIASAGDIDGDGFADIAISAPTASPNSKTSSGIVYIIKGSANQDNINLFLSFNTENIFRIYGAYAADYFGYSIGNSLDINKDGYSDLIISAGEASDNARINSGTTYIIYGNFTSSSNSTSNTNSKSIYLDSFSSSQGIRIYGAVAGDYSGYSVSFLPDYNGDNKVDILIGSPYSSALNRDNAGKIYILHGLNFTSDYDLFNLNKDIGEDVGRDIEVGITISGAQINQNLGLMAKYAGDINGDGLSDIVTGNSLLSHLSRNRCGQASIVYGALSPEDIDLLSMSSNRGFNIIGAYSLDYAGASVSTAGDINGDGYDDVMIGAYGASPNSKTRAGVSYALYGGYNNPTSQPSSQPSGHPSTQPTSQPTVQPTCQPSTQPTIQPSAQPIAVPTSCPTVQPSSVPSSQPTVQPTMQPTSQPSGQPTTQPSGQPTSQPSMQPYSLPSAQPTSQPSNQPTMQPSSQPSTQPTAQPFIAPTSQPTAQPIAYPTSMPTAKPTSQPSSDISKRPTPSPVHKPTSYPTSQPTAEPTSGPIAIPTACPTVQPSSVPSSEPTVYPSITPSAQPTICPTSRPTGVPSLQPTSNPTAYPSSVPSAVPSSQPTSSPTSPSAQPTASPSGSPSGQPSSSPSGIPSGQPSSSPSAQPSAAPSGQPSSQPSTQPTSQPSVQPSSSPSGQPSVVPSGQPTSQPSSNPTTQPTSNPTSPTSQPSASPTILAKTLDKAVDLLDIDSYQGISVNGEKPFDYSGSSVLFIGDADNDGYDDVLIAAPQASPNGRANAGTVYVVYGSYGDAIPSSIEFTIDNYRTSKIYGANAGDQCGINIARAGDINKDGYADFLISCYLASPNGNINAGTVYLIYGNSRVADIDLLDFKFNSNSKIGKAIYGANSYDHFGYALAVSGDKIVVSAPEASPYGRTNAGIVYLIANSESSSVNVNSSINDSSSIIDLSNQQTLKGTIQVYGASAADFLGFSLDGSDDKFIIGAPSASENNKIGSGVSYIIYNSISTEILDLERMNLTQGFKIIGASAGDSSGYVVRFIKDFNNDGMEDILVSAPSYSAAGKSNAGAVYVLTQLNYSSNYSSNYDLSLLSKEVGIRIIGEHENDNIGKIVTGGGDSNGDGLSDIIIGLPENSYLSRNKCGKSVLVYGSMNVEDFDLRDIDPKSGLAIYGARSIDGSGKSVDIAGDFNGDGRADILIGSPGASPNARTKSGSVNIVYGGYNNPTSQPTAQPSSPTSRPTSQPTSSPTIETNLGNEKTPDLEKTSTIATILGLGGTGTIAIGAFIFQCVAPDLSKKIFEKVRNYIMKKFGKKVAQDPEENQEENDVEKGEETEGAEDSKGTGQDTGRDKEQGREQDRGEDDAPGDQGSGGKNSHFTLGSIVSAGGIGSKTQVAPYLAPSMEDGDGIARVLLREEEGVYSESLRGAERVYSISNVNESSSQLLTPISVSTGTNNNYNRGEIFTIRLRPSRAVEELSDSFDSLSSSEDDKEDEVHNNGNDNYDYNGNHDYNYNHINNYNEYRTAGNSSEGNESSFIGDSDYLSDESNLS